MFDEFRYDWWYPKKKYLRHRTRAIDAVDYDLEEDSFHINYHLQTIR